MSTKPAEKPLETYYYLFNLQHVPADPLKPIGPIVHMENTPDLYLKHYGYEPAMGSHDNLAFYRSSSADAKYLVVALCEPYRFVFHVRDDRDLVEWKRRFEPYAHMLADMPGLLPSAVAPPDNTTTFHLDRGAVRANGGVW